MLSRLLLILASRSCYVSCLPEPEAGLDASHIHTLSRLKRGGECTSTADCVTGNVCSKWGWCQWTSIYGSDGPSQGSSAPGGGKAGQCVTSADCASRVPYCSKLGFCHGGRLPFDEAQIEIPDDDKVEDEDQPQGFINNNPRKNNPHPSIRKSGNKKSGGSGTSSSGGSRSSAAAGGGRKSGNGGGSKSGNRASSNGNSGHKASNNRRSGNNQRKSGNQRQNGNSRKPSGGNKRKSGSNGGGNTRGGNRTNQQSKTNNRKQNGGSGGDASACPGGNLDACIDACIPIQKVAAYGACVTVCGNRCK